MADERRLRRTSSAASTYAVESGDAGDGGGGGGGGRGGANASLGAAAGGVVDVDYLDAVIDHEDEHSSSMGGGGSRATITKTFKSPEDEQMRTFMTHKDNVLGDLGTIASKAEEIRRITKLLDDVYVF